MLEKNKSGKTQDFNFWWPFCPTVGGNNYHIREPVWMRRPRPTYCHCKDHRICHHSVYNGAEKKKKRMRHFGDSFQTLWSLHCSSIPQAPFYSPARSFLSILSLSMVHLAVTQWLLDVVKKRPRALPLRKLWLVRLQPRSLTKPHCQLLRCH